jgi:hypothetical protein
MTSRKHGTLHELGLKHGTDKTDENHQYKGIGFLDTYERYFEPRRLGVKTFVEIGVQNGQSLRLWEEYFPNASIFGVDINPLCKKHETDRIKVFIGDQNDHEFLQDLRQRLGPIDILLDDGSHVTRHQIATFDVLYPSIQPGGLFIIEDLICSYEEVMNVIDVRKEWPGGMKYNKKTDDLKNYRSEFVEFIEEKVNRLDKNDPKFPLLGVHYYSQIVIFENV